MAAVGMSEYPPTQMVPVLHDIEHVDQLSDNIGALFMQENYSDITLVVDGQKFPAHKVILASRSEYFRYKRFDFRRTVKQKCTHSCFCSSYVKLSYNLT